MALTLFNGIPCSTRGSWRHQRSVLVLCVRLWPSLKCQKEDDWMHGMVLISAPAVCTTLIPTVHTVILVKKCYQDLILCYTGKFQFLRKQSLVLNSAFNKLSGFSQPVDLSVLVIFPSSHVPVLSAQLVSAVRQKFFPTACLYIAQKYKVTISVHASTCSCNTSE